jgi:hypothetical protein
MTRQTVREVPENLPVYEILITFLSGVEGLLRDHEGSVYMQGEHAAVTR